MRGRACAAGFFLAVLSAPHSAGSDERDVMRADTLFREGRALMKSGNYESACPKLEESYRLDPAAGTGINLGDCFEKQGKVASALLAYQAARALLKAGDPRIGPVEKEIAALDKRAPRLTIKLAPGAPDGTTVKRDGREVEASKLGLPVAVNPGKHTVTVLSAGAAPRRRSVAIAESERREIVVEADEPDEIGQTRPASVESGAPAKDDSPDVQRTLGFVALAAGAAALGVAGYYFFKANSVGDKCTSAAACNALEEEDQAHRDKATIWGIIGGVSAAGGAAVVLLTAPEADTGSRRNPAAATYSVQISGRW